MLETTKHRQHGNVKIDLRGIKCGDVDKAQLF
jgi:hypothetical protein